MNRAERRKAVNGSRGHWYVDEKTYQRALDKGFENARRVALAQTQIVWNCFLLGAKDVLGAENGKIKELQEYVKARMEGLETATELAEKCREECGIDCTRLIDDELNGEDIDELVPLEEGRGTV